MDVFFFLVVDFCVRGFIRCVEAFEVRGFIRCVEAFEVRGFILCVEAFDVRGAAFRLDTFCFSATALLVDALDVFVPVRESTFVDRLVAMVRLLSFVYPQYYVT